jgi:hypothetical protein
MSASKESCAAANTRKRAKLGTYDIVASSILNLRAGQRNPAQGS